MCKRGQQGETANGEPKGTQRAYDVQQQYQQGTTSKGESTEPFFPSCPSSPQSSFFFFPSASSRRLLSSHTLLRRRLTTGTSMVAWEGLQARSSQSSFSYGNAARPTLFFSAPNFPLSASRLNLLSVSHFVYLRSSTFRCLISGLFLSSFLTLLISPLFLFSFFTCLFPWYSSFRSDQQQWAGQHFGSRIGARACTRIARALRTFLVDWTGEAGIVFAWWNPLEWPTGEKLIGISLGQPRACKTEDEEQIF
ncbi:unnamed protein product [Closterium sp. Yama58-4]|nr:unnamed protein product [Closterium sp. Yama58-4]